MPSSALPDQHVYVQIVGPFLIIFHVARGKAWDSRTSPAIISTLRIGPSASKSTLTAVGGVSSPMSSTMDLRSRSGTFEMAKLGLVSEPKEFTKSELGGDMDSSIAQLVCLLRHSNRNMAKYPYSSRVLSTIYMSITT